jgi:hypothetical protein
MIKLFFFTLPTMVLLIFCSVTETHKNKNNLRAITVHTNMPVLSPAGNEFVTFSDSLNIYYYEDLVLFEHPYINEFLNFVTNPDGDVVRQDLIKTEMKYSYFIYQSNSVKGYRYDSLTAQQGHRLLVDSFFKTKGLYTTSVYDKKNDSLVETVRLKDGNILEKYVSKIKYDEGYPDSTFFYFTGFYQNIPYSFSKALDSVKHKKIYNVKLIHNPLPKNVFGFEAPRREFIWHLNEMSISNPKQIISFFQRFKRDIKSL